MRIEKRHVAMMGVFLLVFLIAGALFVLRSKKDLPQIVETIVQKVEEVKDEVRQQLGPAVPIGPRVVDGKLVYPLHTNITATLFWAGEEADKDNKDISNLPSAWDEKWSGHYGGVDDPKKRNGYLPAKFTPKENPFYFALPYNDFTKNGKRKQEVATLVPWAKDAAWGKNESVLKNHWVKVSKGDKVVYAQWEDVGPFNEDDTAYVFGGAQPKSKTNKHAGIDLSPAVNDYLGLKDIDTVDWQFVDAKDVPDGPWKEIVTTSQIFWK
jgi:hypothetical protein